VLVQPQTGLGLAQEALKRPQNDILGGGRTCAWLDLLFNRPRAQFFDVSNTQSVHGILLKFRRRTCSAASTALSVQ
jgi:hypothetical protein